MGLFRRARDFPGRFRQMDSLMVLLIGIALLWFVGAFNPQRFIGPISSGPSCTSMASPDNDNSRSLLAFKDDQQELELMVRVSEQVAPSGTLTIDVIFVNPDQGPVVLYLPETVNTATLSFGQQARSATVNVQITSVTNGQQTWGIYPSSSPPGTQSPISFPADDLYLLLADEQCYVRYQFTFDELRNQNIVPGQYKVQAFYSNSNPGQINTIPAVDPTTGLVPTFAFSNQGVWVPPNGTLTSPDNFFFNVLQTAAPTVAP